MIKPILNEATAMPVFRTPFFRAYGFWHWGEGFQTVLFTWYMAFHANLTPSQIGFFQALVLSPFLILTVFGGALTDRIGARLSYGSATMLFAAILFSYGLIDHLYGFVPHLFFVYCLAAGVVSAISNPAIDTFIPEATPHSVQTNTLTAANAHNIAKLTGTLTGLALPVLLALGGFALNGLLMVLSVLSLRAHRRPKPAIPNTAPPRLTLARIRAHYRTTPENFDILLSSGLLGLIIVPVGYILFPLVLRARFPEASNLFALLGICSWIGAITATTLATRLSPRITHPGRLALTIWAIYGLGLLLLLGVNSFPALCLCVMGFGTVKLGKALVYGTYLANCADTERGLFVAIDQTAFWGLATLGTAGLGALVDLIGLDPTILIASFAVLTGTACLALRAPIRRITPA